MTPTPAPVHIRFATVADAELLGKLGGRTFRDTFSADNTAENMEAYVSESFNVAKQTSEIADPNGWVKIAESNSRAVGYAVLNAAKTPSEITGGKPIELVRLYVLQESIGSGVGAALMLDAINESQRRGFETLWLGVWEHNERAIQFYQKWGFVKVGTHVFQLGDDPQTDFLMQKQLD